MFITEVKYGESLMNTPTRIVARGGRDDLTILTIIAGELRNWGYTVTEPKLEYEPNWGESELMIEVTTNGGG